jgi:glycosyltransferase involved in cell wall biosynthesis
LVAPTNRRQRYLRDECLDALQATDLFMPVSSYIAEWLESLGVPSKSVRTNYLGIDTQFWSSDEVVTTRSQPPRLLFVGNLTELKGVVDLVRCSIQLQSEVEHTLEIIGDGPLRDQVNQLAASHSHIEVRGRMNRLGVREAMSRAWCFGLPTRTHLGLADAAPFVLMEAQSMGVPAVTFNVGGTAEMVASPEFLVAENDLDALRHKLVQVLTLDADSRQALGTKVREWITANRSRNQGVRVTLDQYRRLLGRS